MDSSTETEAKFDAAPDWELPALADLVARDIPATQLVADYWDTHDRRLDDWGVTLRRRDADGGARTEWTIKLPLRGSADGVQRRQELTIDTSSTTPPAELRTLLTAMARGAALEPVARIITDRRRRRVGNDLWTDAVEITDDRVTSRVAGRTGPAFRQIEVELLDDEAHDVMGSVIDSLRTGGLDPSRDDSKLRRVLGSSAPDPNTPTPASKKKRKKNKKKPTLAQLTSTAVGRGVTEFVRTDPCIRLHDDMEAVHTYRKAIRRLRSDLRTLRPVLDEERSERLRDELQWFAGLLGEVRDLHVLRARLLELAEQVGITSEQRDAIVRILDAQLEVERRNLLSAMAGDRYLQLIERLTKFQRRPRFRSGVNPAAPARTALDAAARSSWKKVEKARRRATRQPTSEHLHTLRKKVKHVRITAQLSKDVGAKPKQFVRAAGVLKEDLGDLHDADVLIAWLDELPDRLDSDAAYAAGRLREHTVARRAELADAWSRSWKELDRGRLRRWMD